MCACRPLYAGWINIKRFNAVISSLVSGAPQRPQWDATKEAADICTSRRDELTGVVVCRNHVITRGQQGYSTRGWSVRGRAGSAPGRPRYWSALTREISGGRDERSAGPPSRAHGQTLRLSRGPVTSRKCPASDHVMHIQQVSNNATPPTPTGDSHIYRNCLPVYKHIKHLFLIHNYYIGSIHVEMAIIYINFYY